MDPALRKLAAGVIDGSGSPTDLDQETLARGRGNGSGCRVGRLGFASVFYRFLDYDLGKVTQLLLSFSFFV